MSFHPEAYEPQPGDAVFPDGFYSPYQVEVLHPTFDAQHGPAFGLQSGPGPFKDEDPLIDHDLAAWLLRRFVNDLPEQPEEGAIPSDHDVRFDGSVGPTIAEAVGEHNPIDEIWDRVLNQTEYDDASMTNDLFGPAMEQATSVADELAPAPEVNPGVEYSTAGPEPEQLASNDPVAEAQQIFDQQIQQRHDAAGSAPQQAYEQPDPFKQQQMYDEQLQQLMNPFMMPGP